MLGSAKRNFFPSKTEKLVALEAAKIKAYKKLSDDAALGGRNFEVLRERLDNKEKAHARLQSKIERKNMIERESKRQRYLPARAEAEATEVRQ